MRGICIVSVLIGLLIFATVGLAQEGINASLGGTVSDPTGALIPGVDVTAKNTATGVTSTTLTNESGTYRFPSLQPGTLGTLGLNPIYGPGSWNFDGNLQKKIRIKESSSLAIRLDALNILNHPTPATPNLNINNVTFGQITTKTGSRTLAGQIRLEF